MGFFNSSLLRRLASYSKLVVLPHSVFALPFALASFIIAFRRGPLVTPWGGAGVAVLLVICAVVSARTAAMAFNRYLDRNIDSTNPRTVTREIPSGNVTPKESLLVVAFSSMAFFLSTWALGWHCLLLAPFVYVWLLLYSFAKRFTSGAHVILGTALALAPGGAWWVLRPSIEITPLLLMAGVLSWVAGFDIIYSCQDVVADRKCGLYSIPSQVGIDSALMISRTFHFLAFCLFLLTGLSTGFEIYYFLGVVFVIGLPMFIQHRMVKPWDLSQVSASFFTANGVLSILFLVLVALSS